MKTILEKAIVGALLVYIEKAVIKPKALVKRLGWSPSDLNSILKGKKGIGKNRQAYLEDKLGMSFKNEILIKMGELSAIEREKPGIVAGTFPEYLAERFALTDSEERYVKKLLTIFRTKDNRTIRATAQVLDTFLRVSDGVK